MSLRIAVLAVLICASPCLGQGEFLEQGQTAGYISLQASGDRSNSAYGLYSAAGVMDAYGISLGASYKGDFDFGTTFYKCNMPSATRSILRPNDPLESREATAVETSFAEHVVRSELRDRSDLIVSLYQSLGIAWDPGIDKDLRLVGSLGAKVTWKSMLRPRWHLLLSAGYTQIPPLAANQVWRGFGCVQARLCHRPARSGAAIYGGMSISMSEERAAPGIVLGFLTDIKLDN